MRYLVLLTAAIALAVTALAIHLNADTTAAPQQVKPAAVEPYGGCDEAFRYPKSEGYAWCRDHGYLD